MEVNDEILEVSHLTVAVDTDFAVVIWAGTYTGGSLDIVSGTLFWLKASSR